ncbi:MAG TPA: TetR/AcrR family transcriptional regulator [Candidatus Acidoferrum sp.]|nr:TetR/AcrR family transcriptional regulator [Candidatus Acidoferrum sp.]
MKDIKAQLYSCGKELFSERGFKETGVSEITKAAGIGTGTFYNYYSSKEDLFMAIYLDENEKLKKRVMRQLDPEQEPLLVIKELMRLNLEGMKANPILREWYNKEVFGKIEQRYREEKGIEHLDFLYDDFLKILAKWQVQGKMRSDIDREMIMAIFTAILTIETHKEEIGLEFFPKLVEYLTEFTIKGLAQTTSTAGTAGTSGTGGTSDKTQFTGESEDKR